MENQTRAGKPLRNRPTHRPCRSSVRRYPLLRRLAMACSGTGTEFARAKRTCTERPGDAARLSGGNPRPAGTLFGVSGYQINFGSRGHLPGDQPDVLVAMNPAACKAPTCLTLVPGGILIVNTGAFGQKNLELAGYPTATARRWRPGSEVPADPNRHQQA